MTAPVRRHALTDRQAPWAFAIGCAAVTAGVIAHLPMFLMGRAMHYRLAGMPMGAGMMLGMALIVVGVAVAGYGLLPRDLAAQRRAAARITIAAPEDASLGWAHWRLMIVMVVALVIDVMKPASLGFTVPGMVSEYGVPAATASLVPFSALSGTVAGSFLWGALADVYGRKASILLSAVMFVGTSVCGAMPSLAWNVGMCFMMGLAAGGMLPVTYALLAEMMPTRYRSGALVLVGGLGAVGGYFAASGASALLQPIFGWRILWLINLPTGLVLVLLGAFIPESAKFLLARGRVREAAVVMERFGSRSSPLADARPDAGSGEDHPPAGHRVGATITALSICALAWGLINFGLLLWLPADLVARGYSMRIASGLLAKSALIALPTVLVAAVLYARWSSKWSLVAMLGIALAGLLLVLNLDPSGRSSPVWPLALLIVGTNGILAILLPYAAESVPVGVRGRTTGWIAACSKGGGLLAQGLSISAHVPSIGAVAAIVTAPVVLALILVASFGRETRDRDLRTLEVR